MISERARLVLAAVCIITACTESSGPAAPSQNVASAGPLGYVLTPAGWRPASSVHRVAPGDLVGVWNGRLQERDRTGQLVSDYGAAPQSSAPAAPGPGALPALGSNWIAFATWDRPAGDAITHDTARWIVPPVPSTSEGQTIFLFNGIKSTSTILQPVLQWGSSSAGGGAYWAAACWYIYNDADNFFNSALLTVSPGDSIVGAVDSTGAEYHCSVRTPRDSTAIGVGGTVPELTKAVLTLEAYGLSQCSDYPDTVYTAFTGLSIRTHSGTPSIVWTPHDSVTDCGQRDSVVSNANPGGENDIYYRPPPPPPPPPLSVSISGARIIRTKGTYTWSANASGGTGGYGYQWVLRYDGGSDQTEGSSQSQQLTVYGGDPNFWWIVTVTSGSAQARDSTYVWDCIGQGTGCGGNLPIGG